MAILVIRHGETAWNAARIVQFPCTPLNDRGKQQAARLGDRLADWPIGLILCSDYARARMTAEPIRRSTGASIEYRASLRERNFGVHRGTPFAKLETDIFVEGYHPPGGESMDMLHARTAAAWAGVAETANEVDGHVAVVSHALVCRSLVQDVLALVDTPEADGKPNGPLRWPNTALTVIDGPPWTLERLACAEHLDESGVADADHPAGI